MKARYTRLYADEHGASKFEDVEVELTKGFAAPPLEPVYNALFLQPEGPTFWLGTPAGWKDDAFHPAPRRILMVNVSGQASITVSDGTTRVFQGGDVLFVEDTTGIGHSTKLTRSEDCIALCVGVAPA
jgi:hypothetical protein